MRLSHAAWWTRKVCHLLLAGVVAWLFFIAAETRALWPIITLGTLGGILVMVDLLRPWLRTRFVAALFESEGRNRVGCLTYGVIGGVVTWIIAGPAVAALAMMLLGVVDGAASVVGRRYGRTPLPYQPRKTWEGSLAGLACGLAIMILWPMAKPTAVCILLAVSLIESATDGMIDNFLSPVVAGTVVSVLRLLRFIG